MSIQRKKIKGKRYYRVNFKHPLINANRHTICIADVNLLMDMLVHFPDTWNLFDVQSDGVYK